MDSPYLTVDETTEYLRYKSRQTVYNKINNKQYIEGLHYIKNGRKPLFFRKALDDMLLGTFEKIESVNEKDSTLELAKPIKIDRKKFKSSINI